MRNFNRVFFNADNGSTGAVAQPIDASVAQPIDAPIVQPVIDTPSADPTLTELKFSQKDINFHIGKAKNDAKLAVLKELGVEDVDNAKEGLKKWKEITEAQKTEAQKQKEEYDAMMNIKTELETRATAAETKLAAVVKGVPAANIDKVIKLAASYEGDTIEAKIDSLLAEIPELLGSKAAPPVVPPISGKINGQSIDELTKLRNETRLAMGLK